MGLKEFWGRVASFQPTTWYVHLYGAWIIWQGLRLLPVPVEIALGVAALGLFAWNEHRQWQRHLKAGRSKWIWFADMIGDAAGPLAVVCSIFWGQWWQTVGTVLILMTLGTITWIGLGIQPKEASHA